MLYMTIISEFSLTEIKENSRVNTSSGESMQLNQQIK